MSKRAWGILILVLLIIAAAAWWVSRSSTAAVVRTNSREQPICTNINTKNEGWAIDDKTVQYAQCQGCTVACENAGTSRADWVITCDDVTQTFIAYAYCSVQPLPPSNV
ncbi:MAG: hypothetical protein AAB728_04465, partial [Patescibacteria group bacterium]